ncbi:MAG TPA: hypothetical protein DC046_07015 [Rhodospirillaceae bacterium]|nr:hypothetical protein [Rhodospirillaceae bacterium]
MMVIPGPPGAGLGGLRPIVEKILRFTLDTRRRFSYITARATPLHGGFLFGGDDLERQRISAKSGLAGLARNARCR